MILSKFASLSLLFCGLFAMTSQASAQVSVHDAWVRATVPGQHATGAFMQIVSTTDGKLVDVGSPAAKLVQIHQMVMNNDVMSMQQVAEVKLPAGTKVALEPSSYHVMLMDLNQQIKEGDEVPFTLTVEDAAGQRQIINVSAPARALNAE